MPGPLTLQKIYAFTLQIFGLSVFVRGEDTDLVVLVERDVDVYFASVHFDFDFLRESTLLGASPKKTKIEKYFFLQAARNNQKV